MENGQDKFTRETVLKGFVSLLLGIIAAVFSVPFILPERFCFASLDYAVFVGGLAGPLASLVGFIYVYLTFLGQQRQLNEQRERLDKEEVQKQRDQASKEFAEYLTIWIEIRSNIKYSHGATGEQAFEDWWTNVRSAVQTGLREIEADAKDGDVLSKILKRHFYSKGFNVRNDQYDNFLRVVYLLIEIAEKNNFQERVKILESFMTRAEKAILVYSATFIDKNQSAIRLFRSGFCKSIPEEYLILPDHRDLIF